MKTSDEILWLKLLTNTPSELTQFTTVQQEMGDLRRSPMGDWKRVPRT